MHTLDIEKRKQFADASDILLNTSYELAFCVLTRYNTHIFNIARFVNVFIGHKKNDGTLQSLFDHLIGTAKGAAAFACNFGADGHAYRTGLLHDIGKYSPAGQRRMNDPENTPKVDHTTAGAKTAYDNFSDMPAAFAISGHHGGLLNIGSRADSPTDGTLLARLKKELVNDLDYTAYANEVAPISGNILPNWLNMRDSYSVHFYIRMLFSCLVDADFLDTESFMSDNTVFRGNYATIEQLTQSLMQYISPWLSVHENSLNGIRSDILRSMIKSADMNPGIYSLTVPTGGGKTISSLTFALNHALHHNKKRVREFWRNPAGNMAMFLMHLSSMTTEK